MPTAEPTQGRLSNNRVTLLAAIVAVTLSAQVYSDGNVSMKKADRMDASGQYPFLDQAPTRRLLVLDVCGVLLGEPMEPLFRAVAQDAGTSPDRIRAVFRSYFRDALWSGQLDEADFWPAFAMACGVGIALPAWATLLRSAMTALPAAACLTRWSRSAEVWLLSNHRHEWLVPALQDAGLHSLPRRLFISSQTGHVKPGPAAYVQVLENAVPGDVLLYIDDHADNVNAFRELGVDGIVADGEGQWTRSVDAWLSTPLWSER